MTIRFSIDPESGDIVRTDTSQPGVASHFKSRRKAKAHRGARIVVTTETTDNV